MPIQGAKPVRLTSSGGITLRSASGIHRVPRNRNLPNDFIRRQHEIDLDELQRFARCGADGGSVALAQDQSSSGSQQSPPAPAQAATPAPAAAPAEKPKPTVAQRKENQQDRIATACRAAS